MTWGDLKATADISKRPPVSINLTGDRVGIAFIGCQHIGSKGVDYDLAERHAEAVRNTDNCYAIFCGDLYDNFIIPKMMMAAYGSSAGPDEQIKIIDEYFDFFGQKIIGVVAGNHELWTPKMCGVDILGLKCAQRNLLYSASSLDIELNLGQAYRLKIRHQYKFNSSLNICHTVKRMYDTCAIPFDVGVIAHHHESGLEFFNRHGLERAAVRVGSYKVNDDYADKHGFENGTANMPMIIFDGQRRKLVGFTDILDGVKYL